ncbi:MAG: DnaJ domain-containing protein [Paludibacteraceae bacterium]|nr:DnaJ domain-containing protein [Paludibacteraceae bacterium]
MKKTFDLIEIKYFKAYFIDKVCKLNPSAKDSQKYIINNNLPSGFMTILERNKDHEPSYSHFIEYDGKEKADYIRLLYKLAIADDGIKDDEWEFIWRIAVKTRIPPHIREYIEKYYIPLRRGAEYEKQKEQEEKIQQFTYKNATISAYTILGVSEDATMEEIQKRYRKLALEYHPDLPKNAGRQKECEEKMKEINIAYERIIERK